jgi:hypothetical protein
MKEGPSEVIGTALESTRLARGAQPQVETTSCTNQREIYNKLLLFATTYFLNRVVEFLQEFFAPQSH